jgi:hypothetical protein
MTDKQRRLKELEEKKKKLEEYKKNRNQPVIIHSLPQPSHLQDPSKELAQ